MKKILLTLCLSIALIACTDPKEAPTQMAQTFLTAYLHAHFEEAIPLCTTVLKEDLEETTKFFKESPQAHQDSLRTQLSEYTFTIDSTTINHSEDTSIVYYQIFLPKSDKGGASKITLIKEGKEWKVSKLL